MNLKHLRVCVALFAVLLPVAFLDAKTKAEKLYADGFAAEQKQDWDQALELYLQALDEKPNDPQFTIAMRRARFQAGQMHVNRGQKLRADGHAQEALGEFQKALIADPSSSIAMQEIRRTQAMIEADAKHAPPPEERGMTPVERAKHEIDDKLSSILPAPELRPVLRTVGPLRINNQPTRVLYETVGKLAGVNVLFDSQFTPPPRSFNVELAASTPEQAFDYLAMLTHTFWKPVSGSAIFVTEDNATKHRDYDDEVVRTFYLTNVTSAQEFQEIATAVRTVADIRRAFTSAAQKALIVRGTVDQVALAEKLVHDLDKPKAEVIVDVIVMQANSARTRDLAASLVTASGQAGLTVPFVFTPRNPVLINGTGSTTTTGTTGTSTTTTTSGTTTGTGPTPQLVSLAGLGHISTNDYSTSLPNALLNMLMTDNRTKVLNSPTVRASDGMKVDLKIGQRIPYATGSFQPGVGTVGVSPLVSTQFNFIDTGVNVSLTPQVHSNSEVTLHVEVEVSSVSQYVDLGGLQQPVIGQNKNSADVRMKDGEINILGGLNSIQDSRSVNGIPGLSSLPVLGKVFFGSEHTDKERGELLIVLIPHIVRTPDLTPENLRGIYSGNETQFKLNYAPRGEASGPAQPEAPKPAAASPAPAPSNPPAAAPAAGAAKISFAPPSVQTATGNAISISVQVENAADVASGSPIRIKFDPSQLRLNDAAPGDLFVRDGARTTSTKDIRNDTGDATLTVSRLPGSPGITGSGSIVVLNFVAIGKGNSTVTVVDAGLKNTQGQPVPVTPGELSVRIQ
jgi:general secretion pathway protein D